MDQLSRTDRQALVLCAVTWGLGLIDNTVKVSMSVIDWRIVTISAFVLLMTAWYIFIGWNLFRSIYRAEDAGLSVTGRRPLMVLAISCIALLIGIWQLGITVLPVVPQFFLALYFVIGEELVFRPILISLCLKIFSKTKYGVAASIVVSALIWATVHIPSYPLSQVIGGMFLGGIAFGIVYYYARSNVFGFTFHAMANVGALGGFIVLGLFLGIAPLIAWRRAQVVATV